MEFAGGTGAAFPRAEAAGSARHLAPAAQVPTDAAQRFPEIDCVRALFAADVLEGAARRAAALGVGADRVLIAGGKLSEETYLRALGEQLGVAFEPLNGIARALCPLDDGHLIETAGTGMLSLAVDDELYVVVAPRGVAARNIIALVEDTPAWARRFRFTSSEHLNRFVLRCAGPALAAGASQRLQQNWPMLSAAPPRWRGNIVGAALLGLVTLAAFAMAPATVALIFELMLAAIFLAWLGLRLIGVLAGLRPRDRAPRLPDDRLPVYTVIAALYREAACVDGLLAAIERLDYPGIMAQTPQAL